MKDPIAIHQPTGFYIRHALRTAKKKADAVHIGLFLASEVETLIEFIRSRGLTPPELHAEEGFYRRQARRASCLRSP